MSAKLTTAQRAILEKLANSKHLQLVDGNTVNFHSTGTGVTFYGYTVLRPTFDVLRRMGYIECTEERVAWSLNFLWRITEAGIAALGKES